MRQQEKSANMRRRLYKKLAIEVRRAWTGFKWPPFIGALDLVKHRNRDRCIYYDGCWCSPSHPGKALRQERREAAHRLGNKRQRRVFHMAYWEHNGVDWRQAVRCSWRHLRYRRF